MGATLETHTVVFTPSGLTGSVADGTTVLEAARSVGADLDTVCGGRGICGRCQVAPTFGAFAKWGVDARRESLGPPDVAETEYRGARPLREGCRLGCVTPIHGDVIIDVPSESQVHRQVVRKDLDVGAFEVDPLFTLWYVEIDEPELGDPRSLADLVRNAVADQHAREAPSMPLRALSMLQPAIAQGGGALTVAVDEDDRVVAVWPGFVDAAYGAAIDVGSTTIAGHLCDLTTGEVVASAGRMNPQIRYGEDLMSRVSYAMMNPGGDRELTEAVRTAIDGLLGDLVDQVQTFREHLLEVVLVGNPVMHHIVLGLDPTPLGQAPFTLTTNRGLRARATDLDLTLPYGRCYVGPCIAGHVGADTAAVMLAERPHDSDSVQLIVDIGTNAEIVIGDRTRQYAASSPTGPAFEGAQTSAGQRATVGAIEHVRIDPSTLEAHVKVIGIDGWLDVAATRGSAPESLPGGVTGICGSGVIDAVAEMFLAGIIDADGTIDGGLAATSPYIVPDERTFAYVLWRDADGDPIMIRQNDVRAIQLAKAALRAGVDLLIERAGDPPIGGISLAGAFGAHIDPLRAMVLGIIPDGPLGAVRSVGNAAGTGAVQMLLSRSLRSENERVVADVVKVETATEPRFQELFVEAMAFPHASAATSHLAAHVDLPEPRPRIKRRRRGARR